MKKSHSSWLSPCLKWFGGSVILGTALVFSFWLYTNGFDNTVYTNNYTTSILYSDSLATASGAAPWALMTLNWFLARSGLKHWVNWITKRFE